MPNISQKKLKLYIDKEIYNLQYTKHYEKNISTKQLKT